MKKLIFLTILMLGVSLSFPSFASAQGMVGNTEEESNSNASESIDHTTQGETEGKVIWEKLQTKELNCEDLSDEDFHSLGMHFMGVMVGDSHEVMDAMMEQMMGEEGENQMHVAIGKRMSGCEEDAPLPQSMVGGGMMPMMSMMMGIIGGNINNTSMMGNWGQNPFTWFGFGSWLVTLTLIVWLIVGILTTAWLWKQLRKK